MAVAIGAALVIKSRAEPSTPLPVGVASTLDSVGCTSSDSCFAVGSYEGGAGSREPLVEHYDGSGWSVQVAPSRGSAAVLRSVACSSAGWCVAGGASEVADPAHQHALLETWDGRRWSMTTVPALPDPSSLQAAQCDATVSCRVVGWSSASGVATPFVDTWNGHTWTLASLPVPGQGANDGGFLQSIACTGPRSCLAVGLLSTNDGGDGTATLAEAWNGSRWALLDTPSPEVLTGDMSALQSIACAAASSCFAVGSYARGNVFNTSQEALLEAWNGSDWSVVTRASPDSGSQSELNTVACPTRSTCVAAGWSTDGGQQKRGLVVAWNGLEWGTVAGLDGAGEWHGVSCPRSGMCLLVGESQGAGDKLGRAAAAWWRGPSGSG
ncbi:MAG TPA: hypothetical protein VF137_07510 [Candidatus Dormibacteraeota bacterium]